MLFSWGSVHSLFPPEGTFVRGNAHIETSQNYPRGFMTSWELFRFYEVPPEIPQGFGAYQEYSGDIRKRDFKEDLKPPGVCHPGKSLHGNHNNDIPEDPGCCDLTKDKLWKVFHQLLILNFTIGIIHKRLRFYSKDNPELRSSDSHQIPDRGAPL